MDIVNVINWQSVLFFSISNTLVFLGTLQHILTGCKVALCQGRYKWRHDQVLREIAQCMDQRRLENNKAPREEKRLESEITQLEINQNKTEDDMIILSQKKNDLQILRERKIEGIILRAKARWASLS